MLFYKNIYKDYQHAVDLFSIQFNSIFKTYDDAYRELVLYLYFKHDYNTVFDIKDIYYHQSTTQDIDHLNRYLENFLKNHKYGWEITKINLYSNN